jgi:predicted permease
MGTLWQDLFHAGRRLRGSPGFTLAAVLTLALGIGANTAIFQLVEAVQLRTLPVRDPGSLVEIRIADMEGARGSFVWHAGLTNPIWEELERRQKAVAGVFAWSPRRLSLDSKDEPRFATAMLASGKLFDTLGVRPALGRLLGERDDQKGCSAPAVVLSHAFWQREYGADPGVVGRKINLERYPFEVVGVAAPGFTGLEVGRSFDVAVPLCAEALPPGSSSRLESGTAWFLVVMGRLERGQTRERASAELKALSPGLFETTLPANYPRESVASYLGFKLEAQPASGGISLLRERYSASLLFLQAAAALVLLVGCANLASLVLARATSREREIAARMALGAGRGRVVRLLLSESLLLAAFGALAGAWLASGLSSVLVSAIDSRPSSLFLDLGFEWRVFGFAAAAATLTCALFGLVPALRAARVSPETVLRSSGRGNTEGRARLGLRRALVVGQVALSLVLVTGAFLFARSLVNLLGQDTGMALDAVEIVSVDMRPLEPSVERRLSLRREVYGRLRAVPGVVSVAETTLLPLSGSAWGNAVWRDGGDRAARIDASFAATSPDYFRTMGVALLAGRTFDERDTSEAPLVAVVNQAFASAVFGGSHPLGGRFWVEATPDTPERLVEVVGLVEDTAYRDLRRGRPPIAYVALSQDPDPSSTAQLVVRTEGDPKALVPSLRAAIREVHPALATTFRDYGGLVERLLVRERVVAGLSGFFGLLALLLATLGLYGVMAFAVVRRTSEIGIRMALGAERAAIVKMVLREALALVALGIAVGLALSLALAHTVRSLVFGLEPNDPLTIGLASAVLGLVGLAASYLPARRAARLDPVTALRRE